MKLNISAFTHAGTVRDANQDGLLVNGRVLNSGDIHLTGEDRCVCFVADGVGGNRGGDFASRFVLEGVARAVAEHGESGLEEAMREVNRRLLALSGGDERLRGAATTLTGLVADASVFRVLHAGDSQLWLRRDGSLFKVTSDQVVDEGEPNSPLTSFFGGAEDSLRFDQTIFVREVAAGDLFLLCSDGLFKALDRKDVRAVLRGGGDIRTQAWGLLEGCLQRGADDNVSAILIERTE
jgi:serine/threonine protein phosphatase PrpC